MSEQRMWEHMRSEIQEHWGSQGHAQRIENAIDDGPFDVELVLDGVGFWVELKQCRRPWQHKAKLPIEIRLSQVHWYARRYKAGGGAAFVIKVQRQLFVVTDPELVVKLYRNEATLDDLIAGAAFITKHLSDRRRHSWIPVLEWCINEFKTGGAR